VIVEYRATDKTDKLRIAGKLAEILDTVNFLHPFREGNGRTQREFLRILALEKGFELNLNPADNADVYKRYMDGTINGDEGKLTENESDEEDSPPGGDIEQSWSDCIRIFCNVLDVTGH
jgi:cell filamentation protein